MLIQNIKNYSTKLLERTESFVVVFAILAMLGHILLIFLSKAGIIYDTFLQNQNYLQSISTPFTIILIYEILLLILSVSKSLPIAIGKQYEIITLVLVRDVFKIISTLDLQNGSGLELVTITSVGMDIIFAIICFVLIHLYNKSRSGCSKLMQRLEEEEDFKKIKLYGSLILFILFVGFLYGFVVDLYSANNSETFFATFKALGFISELFVAMILIDIVLLLVAFKRTHEFRDIFYEAVLVISAIVVRFAFVSETPLNGILACFGILLGLVVTIVYLKQAKYK